MRIPIPAIVVPFEVLLLYLFVPGLRQKPWTTLRIAGAIVALVGYILFIIAFQSSVGKVVFGLAPSKATRYARSLCADSESHLRLHRRYVVMESLIVSLQLNWLFVPFVMLLVMQLVRADREAKVRKKGLDRVISSTENKLGFFDMTFTVSSFLRIIAYSEVRKQSGHQ